MTPEMRIMIAIARLDLVLVWLWNIAKIALPTAAILLAMTYMKWRKENTHD